MPRMGIEAAGRYVPNSEKDKATKPPKPSQENPGFVTRDQVFETKQSAVAEMMAEEQPAAKELPTQSYGEKTPDGTGKWSSAVGKSRAERRQEAAQAEAAQRLNDLRKRIESGEMNNPSSAEIAPEVSAPEAFIGDPDTLERGTMIFVENENGDVVEAQFEGRQSDGDYRFTANGETIVKSREDLQGGLEEAA